LLILLAAWPPPAGVAAVVSSVRFRVVIIVVNGF
jgi:hypothetical protein